MVSIGWGQDYVLLGSPAIIYIFVTKYNFRLMDLNLDDLSGRQGHHKTAAKIPIWICGPSQLGRHNFTIYFYYETR